MNDGYGKLFLLLLAIALIFLAASGKGLAVWAALTGKSVQAGSGASGPVTSTSPNQSIPAPNPTDLRTPGSSLGGTDATKGANVG